MGKRQPCNMIFHDPITNAFTIHHRFVELPFDIVLLTPCHDHGNLVFDWSYYIYDVVFFCVRRCSNQKLAWKAKHEPYSHGGGWLLVYHVLLHLRIFLLLWFTQACPLSKFILSRRRIQISRKPVRSRVSISNCQIYCNVKAQNQFEKWTGLASVNKYMYFMERCSAKYKM